MLGHHEAGGVLSFVVYPAQLHLLQVDQIGGQIDAHGGGGGLKRAHQIGGKLEGRGGGCNLAHGSVIVYVHTTG